MSLEQHLIATYWFGKMTTTTYAQELVFMEMKPKRVINSCMDLQIKRE